MNWVFASPQNPHKVRVHGCVPHKKPTYKTAQSGTIRHGVLGWASQIRRASVQLS